MARAGLEELLEDCRDYPGVRDGVIWAKESHPARYVRKPGCDPGVNFEA